MKPEGYKELEELRKAISRFHSLRNRVNESLLMGTSKLTPQQTVEIVRSNRDPQTEAEAVDELRDLLTLIHQREVTPEDLRSSLSSLGSLGVIPLAIYPVVAGGAITLTALFNYLAGREERIMNQLGGGSSLLYNPLFLLALGIGGATAGIWYWRKNKKTGSVETKAEAPAEHKEEHK